MKQIRLSQGLYALVNEEDYDYLMQWTWSAACQSRGTKWYAVRTVRIGDRHSGKNKTQTIRMHVEVIKRMGIKIPPGHVVDHVNHNSLDNRRYVEELDYAAGTVKFVQQLEVITQTENMRRSPGWKKKGVKHEKRNIHSG